MNILVRSWQDIRKILCKILPRYCRELQDVMVRSYQDIHCIGKLPIVVTPSMKKEEPVTWVFVRDRHP